MGWSDRIVNLPKFGGVGSFGEPGAYVDAQSRRATT
jgi:hypothetical protein